MATLRLMGVSGVYAGVQFALAPGESVVGRSPEMAVCLARDETVSRRHALITVGPGGATIRDLESRNGTFVNGARVHSAQLAPGAALQIGSTIFQIAGAARPIEREPMGLESALVGVADLSDPRRLAALGYIGNLVGIPLFFLALTAAARARAAAPAAAAPGATAAISPQGQIAQFLEFHGRQARALFVVELVLALILALPAIFLVYLPLIIGGRGLGFVGAALGIGLILGLGCFFAWMNVVGLLHARQGTVWAAPLWNWLGRRV